jgi:2-polyprenyl-3-methyl-5-hydroxy-6-metoxy-1,4-benzoquinol methylase
MTAERERLERIAATSTYSAGVMGPAIRHCAEIFLRHLGPGPTLELGPAEGLMTDLLAPRVPALTVVEAGEPFCRAIRERHPRVTVVHALFEEYRPAAPFQNVILGHVLEHVAEPVALLRRVAGWLAPGGRVLAAVPNARSLHRQAAVLMGLLPSEDALNARDLAHGHRRVYDPGSLRRDFEDAGLRVEASGGYWLKPLSNAQIEASWTDAMVEAFMRLGERHADVAAEIYVVAGR